MSQLEHTVNEHWYQNAEGMVGGGIGALSTGAAAYYSLASSVTGYALGIATFGIAALGFIAGYYLLPILYNGFKSLMETGHGAEHQGSPIPNATHGHGN